MYLLADRGENDDLQNTIPNRALALRTLVVNEAYLRNESEWSDGMERRLPMAGILRSAADVQKANGTSVRNVPRESQPGAGGTCANFATSEGKLYLGVSETRQHNSAVASVPESVYPKREKLAGVGDDAVLIGV